MVYLFLSPLQQNSGHHIPFPQPENLKSRVPFVSEKLATLLFSGLPLLGPSSHAISAAPARPQLVHRQSTGSWHSISLLHLYPPPTLFLQLPPIHSPSTAHPPDPDIRSRSSISSLLPCYFCSSRPSTARPPPPDPDPSLASSHAISAAPVHGPSTARPPPVHRISLSLLRL